MCGWGCCCPCPCSVVQLVMGCSLLLISHRACRACLCTGGGRSSRAAVVPLVQTRSTRTTVQGEALVLGLLGHIPAPFERIRGGRSCSACSAHNPGVEYAEGGAQFEGKLTTYSRALSHSPPHHARSICGKVTDAAFEARGGVVFRNNQHRYNTRRPACANTRRRSRRGVFEVAIAAGYARARRDLLSIGTDGLSLIHI